MANNEYEDGIVEVEDLVRQAVEYASAVAGEVEDVVTAHATIAALASKFDLRVMMNTPRPDGVVLELEEVETALFGWIGNLEDEELSDAAGDLSEELVGAVLDQPSVVEWNELTIDLDHDTVDDAVADVCSLLLGGPWVAVLFTETPDGFQEAIYLEPAEEFLDAVALAEVARDRTLTEFQQLAPVDISGASEPDYQTVVGYNLERLDPEGDSEDPVVLLSLSR